MEKRDSPFGRKTMVLVLLLLVELFLIVTGLGVITNGALSITILLIPVILAAICLGFLPGLLLGGVFGLGSMWTAMHYSRQTLDSLFVHPQIALIPRILAAALTFVLYQQVSRRIDDHTLSSEVIASGIAAFGGTLANTVFVTLALFLYFSVQMGIRVGVSSFGMMLKTIVGANMAVELVITVAAAAVLVPLLKGERLKAELWTRPISKTFHKWLVVVMSGAFLLTLICSFLVQTAVGSRNAEADLDRVFQELELQEETEYLHPRGIGQSGVMAVVKGDRIEASGLPFLTGLTLEQAGLEEVSEEGLSVVSLEGSSYLCKALFLDHQTVIGLIPEAEAYANRNEMVVLLLLINLVLFLSMFALISRLLKAHVVEPICSVNEALSSIQKGNLEEIVDVRGNEEFAALSGGINATVEALKQSIQEVAARMDQEMEFAREIQRSSLPLDSNVVPGLFEYRILGTMEAAREVGGDFYDYFMIGTDRMGFVIADVSGKGVPAALFMMTSKTLIKNFCLSGTDPAKVLELANEQLCENNETGMFVTVWLGILNYRTGELEFANAGHNPPLLMSRGCEPRYMDAKTYRRSIMLGLRSGIAYHNNRISLSKGDQLFLYTDGVTEACSRELSLYGEQRLKACVSALAGQSPAELIQTVRQDLREFSKGAEQSDDITMVALNMDIGWHSIKLPVSGESTGAAIAFLEQLLESEPCSMKVQNAFMIAVDELFSNIVKYSRAKQAELRCGFTADRGYLEFSDDGIPYNPLEAAEPDLDLELKDRPIGGLGIYMVRKMMDQTEYRYEDGHNYFTVGRRLQ